MIKTVLPHLQNDWFKHSQYQLSSEISRIRLALEQRSATFAESADLSEQSQPVKDSQASTQSVKGKSSINDPEPVFDPVFESSLDRICEVFGLSRFERSLLLLCAGMEFEPGWGNLCAAAANDPKSPYPTLGLAMSVLDYPNWAALSPAASLRRWQLVEVGAGVSLTSSPLRINERILHYLMGEQYLDERLLQLVEPVSSKPIQIESHTQVVEQAIATWINADNTEYLESLPALQLWGDDRVSKTAIAASICDDLELTLYRLDASVLPQNISELKLIALLCDREYTLNEVALLIDCDRDGETSQPNQDIAIGHFIDLLKCPVIISSEHRRRQHQRSIVTLEVRSPSVREQQTLWKDVLQNLDYQEHHLHSSIDQLVSYFSLSPSHIYNAALKAKSLHQSQAEPSQDFHRNLWNACRLQARPRLDELAQSVDTTSTWEDLILPTKEKFILHDIAAHVRQRLTVYEQWGFAQRSKRGLGISALFAGSSGTGKTMAAEVLGNELQLDVYRIDLSSVIDKYIGETEKNLKRIFDAAEGGGVILLFDEADALFGKRTEVKDSHDRHANVGVSYLLQRMEAYRGLAILTTNLKNSLDQAFLRRLRFVIQFQFPDAEQRTEIWRRSFPKQTPTLDLDYVKLGKLNVAGGNIRNIALNSAFIAADHQEPIQMKHILQAAKIEYIKLEKPMMDSEIKNWV